MKKRFKTLLVMSVLLTINVNARTLQYTRVSDPPPGSEGFTLVEERNNIMLYERWFQYDSTIKAREIRIVFDVNATCLRPAISLLRDEASAENWNANLSQFRIIRESNERWTSYIRYDLPWPFADQDCVLAYDLRPSTSGCLVAFESGTHRIFPEAADVTRMSDIRGYWKFTQQKESIHVEYSVTTMPSKSLPRWMTDPIIRNNLLTMMVKFRMLLEELNEKS